MFINFNKHLIFFIIKILIEFFPCITNIFMRKKLFNILFSKKYLIKKKFAKYNYLKQ